MGPGVGRGGERLTEFLFGKVCIFYEHKNQKKNKREFITKNEKACDRKLVY